MTDAPEPDERAERAFRDALATRAETFEPASLEAPGSRSRRRWLPALVAAAVLALVSGTALAAGVLDDDRNGGTHLAGKDHTAVGTLPAADAGWRWVSWRNVAVQVPEDWAMGWEPGSDWCSDSGGKVDLPPDPYVAVNGSGMIHNDILCNHEPFDWPPAFGEAPEDYWAPHLTFATAGSPEARPVGEESYDGWESVITDAGDGVQLRVLGREGSPETQRILDSARTFETDQNGCDTTSPVQAVEFQRPDPAFDVADLHSVDSVSVCMYSRAPDESTALIGSRLVSGEDAEALLQGIQQAPVGGGPDNASHCMPDDYGDSAIALHLRSGDTTRTMYVYYASCFGNGFDDGTHVRDLTRDSCPLLWGDTVRLLYGDGAVFSRCMTD
jgi:hypothetical protein